MEFYRRYKRGVDKLIFYILFVLSVYLFVTVIFGYVAPFFIALLISIIVEPLVRLLNIRFKIPRALLAAFSIILIALIIGTLGTGIVGKILDEGRAFSISFPYYLQEVTKTIEQIKATYADVIELLPEEVHTAAQYAWMSAVSEITNSIRGMFTSTSASFVKIVPATLLSTVFCLVATFFLIKDKVKIDNMIMQKSPPGIIRIYKLLKKVMIEALGGYIKAQLIIMSVVGTIAISGLIILNYPYALLIGILIACVDALPVLGSGFILWPWALFSAIMGSFAQSVGLLLIYAVITVTRQSMEPKVLGKQIGVYPVVLLMSIYIGLKVFGPFGFLIGPMMVVTINAFEKSDFM